MAAQACLPLLEAEAKARQVLAGKLFGENHPQEVVPVLAQPLISTSIKNIRASQAAGRIMGVGAKQKCAKWYAEKFARKPIYLADCNMVFIKISSQE